MMEVRRVFIPLHPQDEQWVQSLTKLGEFTVKRAYDHALQEVDNGEGSSDRSGTKWLLNNIWQAKVPPKVRSFTRRLV